MRMRPAFRRVFCVEHLLGARHFRNALYFNHPGTVSRQRRRMRPPVHFARHPWLRMPVAYAIRVRVRTDGVPLRSAGHCNVGRLCDVSRYTVSDYAMWACCAIHACMVTAAAAPALMERTEPNWLMYTTSSANSSAFFDRPGPRRRTAAGSVREAVGLHGHRAVDDVHGDHLGVLRNVQVVPRVHQFAGGVSGTQHAGLGRRLRRLDALARLGAFLCDARVPIVHAGANRRVMHHMLVQLGHERAFAVPFVRIRCARGSP